MKDGLDADARSSEASPETLDAAGHQRSRSGGILASFLRSSKDDGTGKAPTVLHGSDDVHHVQEAEGARKASSMATALRQSQGQAIDPAEEWDYSETEWWGWVVLIATWIVFVVGMGSCLGVWSWAWDVGETPYAPPDLEDDATLPITGYYPALVVCTAVTSW
ncbi:hypothetical protein A1F96_04941 [Pyrenophora tritici-repentis]|nr:hypothetical protein TUN205_06403 [Pyrenophora tritici-repentis]KAI1592777.1 hypothetical protein PtrEW13061_003517 [Pyrenophora tritici-repentis]PZC96264.1 hypothetical protein A1F95_05475 [Pyrenophora tritici-repentis]PZD29696.1 hypothetical protein A1F96_04941 [Pyrenophora tritici-repentis]